jgi:hypothetical protein
MPTLTINARVRLSAFNGVATGAIAALIYATFAGQGNELWSAVRFNPLNYLAMMMVCCVNTFVFFGLLGAWPPISRWKGYLLGGVTAVAGSFLCSLVMGVGTGKTGELLFGTAFFVPISGFVGSIAGLVLAHIVRDQDEKA